MDVTVGPRLTRNGDLDLGNNIYVGVIYSQKQLGYGVQATMDLGKSDYTVADTGK